MPPMFRKENRALIVVSVVIATATLFVNSSNAEIKLLKRKQPLAAISEPTLINTATVSEASMPTAVSSLGSLEAIQHVTISSPVAGMVNNIYFKNGDSVTKGMPIAQLDDRQAKADYEKAVSTLDVDRKKYNAQKLAGAAIAAQDLAQSKATVEEDEAEVQNKQAALNQLEITAPFSGTLGDFKINAGDYIKAGDQIVSLVNSQQLQVDYSLSEDLLPKLAKDQMVKVISTAYPNKVFYGAVNYIAPSVDQATRSVSVQALLPNDSGMLSPGMFVHVSQQIATNNQALVVPLQALQADIQGYYVYRVVNDHAVQTPVKIGTRNNTMVQIVSGLQQGDQVVSAGAQKLNDGDAVRILPADATNAADNADSSDSAAPSNATAATNSSAQ
jgi:membrane fusion protein (multidrug efflux system)